MSTPTFEHRHFAKIAAIIAELHPCDRDSIARKFAKELRGTNPRYNEDRFLEAATGNPRGRDRVR